jgi:CRISPR-associated protein Cmr4
MQSKLFHLHALSALHCGTGQSAGVVDLPIARARATNLPLVPGSSLRGVAREEVTVRDKKAAITLFGPERIEGDAQSFAGALAIGDANLLALPVRALAGILCFATSPYILKRYARDRISASLSGLCEPPTPPAGTALVPPMSVNRSGQTLVLGDLDMTAQENAGAKAWAEAVAQIVHHGDNGAQSDLATRFAILPDEILGFLAETATEVRARIAINPETGTVKRGALWYEENLPAETLLWGVYALSSSMNKDDRRAAQDLAKCLPPSGTLLQLGGKAGVGRGLVRFLTQEVPA